MSKKLGELWASVPEVEKYNWRKRAKRMAMQPANANKDSKVPLPSSRIFINKTSMLHISYFVKNITIPTYVFIL